MSNTFQDEIDTNLLVVTAVQGYANNHNISESEAFSILEKNSILSLVREQYDVLHTQSLEETVSFVEDVVQRGKYENH